MRERGSGIHRGGRRRRTLLMTVKPNIMELIQAGKQDEAIALLSQPIAIRAAAGPRSAKAALHAAEVLFGGDVEGTARWMNARSLYLHMSPLERAEQSDEGLQRVIEMIDRIGHGAFL